MSSYRDRKGATSAQRALAALQGWFESRGWSPFDYQRESWRAQLAGESGMIVAPTGAGKSYAASLVPLLTSRRRCRLLYITPLRALARDIHRSLTDAADALAPGITVALRTGDTPESEKRRQRRELPEAVVTTPESLALLLSHEESARQLRDTEQVVLDEWQELLSTKRGVQTELCLARLREGNPGLLTWALGATIGNPREAARAALGSRGGEPRLIVAEVPRPIEIETVSPDHFRDLPWAGHLGIGLIDRLIERLDPEASTLIFTNTRSQAERWYMELFRRLGSAGPSIALHHGSLDQALRREVEEGVLSGRIRWVVATSSLDLGVDFYPLERVVQVGSPKGIARFLQRAGRSAHTPGGLSRIFFVPTHALELLELEAVRLALEDGEVEARRPLEAPMDLLCQHMVTIALGEGFEEDAFYREVTGTWSYRNLSRSRYEEALRFVVQGGESLATYPEYRRLRESGGVYRAAAREVGSLHRAAVGTITSQGMVRLKSSNRRDLGFIEERFAARLRKGETFYFAGRALEFIMLREGTAYVRGSRSGGKTPTATWVGSGLPYSPVLSRYLRALLSTGVEGASGYLGELLEAQRSLSGLPEAGEVLLETLSTGEGEHLFLYPLEGQAVHESLGALLAHRLSRLKPATITVTANDYGFELRTPPGEPVEELLEPGLFAVEGLEQEFAEAVNISELARRRFRGIAQIAGLIFPGFPGAPRRRRELQAGAGLFFDLFSAHEPDHLLLAEARREAMEGELDLSRVRAVLEGLSESTILKVCLRGPSPLCFPLLVKNLAARVSTEEIEARVARLQRRLAAREAPRAGKTPGGREKTDGREAP